MANNGKIGITHVKQKVAGLVRAAAVLNAAGLRRSNFVTTDGASNKPQQLAALLDAALCALGITAPSHPLKQRASLLLSHGILVE